MNLVEHYVILLCYDLWLLHPVICSLSYFTLFTFMQHQLCEKLSFNQKTHLQLCVSYLKCLLYFIINPNMARDINQPILIITNLNRIYKITDFLKDLLKFNIQMKHFFLVLAIFDKKQESCEAWTCHIENE